jgi:chromate reductase
MRVLAVSGSLRAGSYNTALLRSAAELAPPGVDVELFEGLRAVEPFSEDAEGLEQEGVRAWREAIAAADAVLLATPEYNASVPGQLKNAVDWASRPLESAALLGKPAAVIGASTSAYGAVWAQAELRKALAFAGARVLDAQLAVPHAHERAEGGSLRLSPGQRRQLEAVLAELVAAVAPVTAEA